MEKKNRYYCIGCLRKFRKNGLSDGNCPYCQVPARCNTARIVAQVVTRVLRQRGIKPASAKQSYYQYLESDLWRSIRECVLKRDGGKCRCCGRPTRTVHHKSYDRVVLDGKKDEELISLCTDCHKAIEFNDDGSGRPKKNGLKEANAKLRKMLTKGISK